MRINEVVSPLKKYLATVRVSGTMAKTLIDAESSSHAILLLGKMYGKSNVVSVSCVHLDETLIAQPLPSLLQCQCECNSVLVLNGTDEVSRSCSAICFS